MKELIVHNPLIKRYCWSLLRPNQFWIYMTIYAAVIVLLLFINYSLHKATCNWVPDEKFYRSLYHQFLGMQVIILWIWSAANSMSALRDEVSNKTYDFFRLLPLSALQKALGILFGKNLITLLFSAIGLVLATLFGLLAKVSISLQMQVVLVLLSTALFVNSLVLLLSNTTVRKHGRIGIGIWILLAVIIGPFLLALLSLSFSAVSLIHKAQVCFVRFYVIELPVLVWIALVALYFGFWNIIGIVRKFTFEAQPLFTARGAFLFLAGYELIVTGFFLPHLSDSQAVLYYFWMASLIPVVFVSVGSLKSFDGYLEYAGLLRSRSDSLGRGMTFGLLLYSNLVLAVGLFALWVIFAAVVSSISHVSIVRLAFDIIVILSFYSFLLILIELRVLYTPIYNKIGLLLGFLGILYIFLPLMLSLIFENPGFSCYSPFGFFPFIFNPLNNQEFTLRTSVLIVNVLLSVGPAMFVARRYLQVLALRRTM